MHACECICMDIFIISMEYKKPWIEYADIMKGGELKFLMGDEPVVWY